MRTVIFITTALALTTAVAQSAETGPHIDTSGVNMQPAYPASAMQDKERGAAVLRVGVTETGKVRQIRLLQTSGFDDLDAAAIAAVMGWHFIPAISGGEAVPGNANFAIGFQPPGSDAAQSAAPKPASDFFPPVLYLEAPRNHISSETHAIPCANGRLEATVEFLHANGPAEAQWATSASLEVQKGKEDARDNEWASLFMIGLWSISPPQERFEFDAGKGTQNDTELAYSHSATLGGEETFWVTWDSAGLVTANVGGMEHHEVRFTAPPTQLSVVMSGGAANFRDPELICYPAAPPDSVN